ncbi:response regulator transcription factor [Spectribacter hydrogenooxidans]|uniref:Response regulator n=1 Tax=Spectribacter hydrogenoxidans TaxID=3075608 RepID=A0ABU3C1J6_9GAMM|nr:response regulator [Salinisphaera sp. W335]MDT0635241.1 response regulator [Salinisphaera sp. W335]
MKVLVIEDDAVFAATLARSLSRRGLNARVASIPGDAIALAQEFAPDAAILDLHLGEDSGLALIEPLLACRPDLRILVLTGFATVQTAVAAIKLGAANYLPKPATAAEILAALSDDAAPTHIEPPSLQRLERDHIERVLDAHGGNISATARALGLHRRTLQRKLAKRPNKPR